MPFEITNQGDYLLLRLLGVISREDLANLAGAVQSAEASSPQAIDRVSDFTGIESVEISFADMRTLAEHRRATTLSRRVKSALVAVRPVEVGFARMFQTLNDHPQIDIRIVKTLDEALRWFSQD